MSSEERCKREFYTANNKHDSKFKYRYIQYSIPFETRVRLRLAKFAPWILRNVASLCDCIHIAYTRKSRSCTVQSEAGFVYVHTPESRLERHTSAYVFVYSFPCSICPSLCVSFFTFVEFLSSVRILTTFFCKLLNFQMSNLFWTTFNVGRNDERLFFSLYSKFFMKEFRINFTRVAPILRFWNIACLPLRSSEFPPENYISAQLNCLHSFCKTTLPEAMSFCRINNYNESLNLMLLYGYVYCWNWIKIHSLHFRRLLLR